ncbi:MAG TPA: hypothetical protein VLI69_01120 [Gammaproteobacteria bacterium]|nr:hypothetical protein [Gammaproteobacteria bacterium]
MDTRKTIYDCYAGIPEFKPVSLVHWETEEIEKLLFKLTNVKFEQEYFEPLFPRNPGEEKNEREKKIQETMREHKAEHDARVDAVRKVLNEKRLDSKNSQGKEIKKENDEAQKNIIFLKNEILKILTYKHQQITAYCSSQSFKKEQAEFLKQASDNITIMSESSKNELSLAVLTGIHKQLKLQMTKWMEKSKSIREKMVEFSVHLLISEIVSFSNKFNHLSIKTLLTGNLDEFDNFIDEMYKFIKGKFLNQANQYPTTPEQLHFLQSLINIGEFTIFKESIEQLKQNALENPKENPEILKLREEIISEATKRKIQFEQCLKNSNPEDKSCFEEAIQELNDIIGSATLTNDLKILNAHKKCLDGTFDNFEETQDQPVPPKNCSLDTTVIWNFFTSANATFFSKPKSAATTVTQAALSEPGLELGSPGPVKSMRRLSGNSNT